MHRILTNTPVGTTATTPMGTFLVRRITDVMTEILQNENSQDTPPKTPSLKKLSPKMLSYIITSAPVNSAP